MGAPVRVDAMREDDVPAVAAMEGPTRMNEGHVRDELARPWSRLWVAREEGAGVVAFVVAWHVADELHVLNVATREDRRRQGVARRLLSEVVAYARANRMKHVLLEVRRSNVAAMALYRGAGFFAMGVRARYYPDDEDAVEMVLLLDPETGAVVAHEDEVRLDG
ncbi:MAG TPA: ribosomal protein S18-alanine N-acetyltransferase [Polyangiaceae bacterium]|jgi:ribosomal-protein-alanine N-acetyltransferase